MKTDNEPRFFQWLVSERRGEVCVLDTIVEEDGDLFLVFKDNSRINENLVLNINQIDVTGKMMAEVENTSKLWQFKEEVIDTDDGYVYQDWESQVKYDVPSTTEIASDGQKVPKKKKQIQLIPPMRTRPEVVASKFGTIINTPTPIAPPPIPEIDLSKPIFNSDDPVYIMMNKSKKKDTEVNMTLTISLPTQSLFDVVKDSFEDGDTKALEYIIENIDISDIKLALKEGIREMYQDEENIGVTKDGKAIHPSNFPNPILPDSNLSDGTQLFEPKCIEEPIISDPKPQEVVDKIEGLKEK